MRIDKGEKDVTNRTGKSHNSRKVQTKTETLNKEKTSISNKRKHDEEPVAEHSESRKKYELNSSFYMSAIPSCNQYIKQLNRSICSKFQKSIITKYLSRFEVSSVSSPFERRVTSIAWHPKYPEISAAASKGGDLLWHHMKSNHDKSVDDYFIPGVGAGGSILGLKFSDSDPATVYTASMTGKIYCNNLHSQSSEVLLSLPLTWDNWFTSLDICYNRNFLMTGDCSGFSYLVKTDGELVWKEKKLHSGKITACDFNKKDPNIFVTSSTDRSVKLWDIRFLPSKSSKQKPLLKMNYERSISSASFSPANRLSLLVTDQHSQIHVYSSPAWSENFTIAHPHRHFQHMTPIKAVWHPMEDIIVVGRYPDDSLFTKDIRTIDFYDGSDGELLHRILSPSGNIVSLNAFNSTGDTFLSTAGFQLVYMQDKNIIKGVSVHHGSNSDDENDDPKSEPFKKKKPPSSNSKGKSNSKIASKSKKV